VLSALSLVLLAGAAVAVTFAIINHFASSIPRVNVNLPILSAQNGAETILITGAYTPALSRLHSGQAAPSGLIMLLHIDANHQHGAVVSIPPDALVAVPGHGTRHLDDALVKNDPTLLVDTVEQVTGVPLAHYAVIDFAHVTNLIDQIGGVDVVLPKAQVVLGHQFFHAGVNHLNGTTGLYYARQPNLAEDDRVLREQSLIRAILRKIASGFLLTNPTTMLGMANSLDSMLTVDSNFTNGALESMAINLSALGGNAGTFVTAPENDVTKTLDTAECDALWAAIKHDSVAAFAKKYPETVTPAAPS
jgi:LCP family protein required for cell wall assembly